MNLLYSESSKLHLFSWFPYIVYILNIKFGEEEIPRVCALKIATKVSIQHNGKKGYS